MSKRRVRLEIYGVVQGVFFRASTRDRARQLGLTGWVRNRGDGSVEALVEGKSDDIGRLIDWANQGPPQAKVDRVDVEEQEFVGEFERFDVMSGG